MSVSAPRVEPSLAASISPSGRYLAVFSPGPCHFSRPQASPECLNLNAKFNDGLNWYVDIYRIASGEVMASTLLDSAYDWGSQDEFVTGVDTTMWRWNPLEGVREGGPTGVPLLGILQYDSADGVMVAGEGGLTVWMDLSEGTQLHVHVAPSCARLSSLRQSASGDTLMTYLPAGYRK